MRAAGYIAVFIGGLVVCYLLISLGVVDSVDGIPGTQDAPSLSLPTYLTFIGVMMTAVTTVLAAVAIGIGIIAAITFRELKDEARSVAEKTSKQVAEDTSNRIASEALSEVKVRKFVEDLYAATQAQKEAQIELREDFDPSDNGER